MPHPPSTADGRPTTAAARGGGRLGTSNRSRTATTRPHTDGTDLYERNEEGVDYYDEAGYYDEEGDEDEGMFSFAAPDVNVLPPPIVVTPHGYDHQAAVMQQQALAAQVRQQEAMLAQQRALELAAGVPSTTSYYQQQAAAAQAQAQAHAHAQAQAQAGVRAQAASGPLMQQTGSTASVMAVGGAAAVSSLRQPAALAPTAPAIAGLSPAAAIAAHYQAPHLYPAPQSASGSHPQTSGWLAAPSALPESEMRSRKRQSTTSIIAVGADKAYTSSLAAAAHAPMIELSGGLRAAGWSTGGRLDRSHSIRSSGSSHSMHKRVPQESMSPDEPEIVMEGYRVAAGGVGAGALKYPGPRSGSMESMLESNLGPGSLGMQELRKRTSLGLGAGGMGPGTGMRRYSVSKASMERGYGGGGDATVVGDLPGGCGRLSGMDQYRLEDFAMDEEDSPYPEVRASVSNIDDPEMPCLTFRSWMLGLSFCCICGCLNCFFQMRYPAPFITPIVVQIISYPAGKLCALTFPDRVFRIPGGADAPARTGFIGFCNRWWPAWLGAGAEWSLNPGPFNIKEHTIIALMANAAVGQVYAVNMTLVMDKYYKRPTPVSFDFLIALCTQLLGFSLAGMTRRFLVWPASMIWPSNLVTCTLLNTFHAEDDDGSDGSVTRFRFFMWAAMGAFAWYWLPGFLFTALSMFSWLCWIRPRERVLNQLFGTYNGLGMGFLTFDWSQIAYIGSPLVVPWWAEVNIIVGFLVFFCILGPALYYSNAWQQAYLPISGTQIYDRYGQTYDTGRIVDLGSNALNVTAYREYSPLFLPSSYTSVYSIGFALSSSAIVHTLLYHGHSILDKLKSVKTEDEDVHAKLMRNYPEVPDWWYWAYFALFTGLSIIVVEVYHTGLPVWGLLLALLVPVVYLLPAGFIFAMTTQQLQINLVAEIVPGYLFPGKPLANMIFKVFGVQTLLNALAFVQDLKLGHYMKLPPRSSFVVQIVAAGMSAAVQIGFKTFLVDQVDDLCAEKQKDLLVCANASVFYSASVIWGLLGPDRQFGPGTLFRPVVYWVVAGIFLPIPFYFLTKRWPDSWLKYVNIPVLLVGASWIPPATGINYTSWITVGFIFQYVLRRKRFRWWSKFNFVLSAGLDTGTVISAITIFFTVQFPMNGAISVNWWGNSVYEGTDDWKKVSFKDPPPQGFGPTTWS